MNRNDLTLLSTHLAATDIDRLELRGPDFSLALVRHGNVIVQEPIDRETVEITVTADGPGEFLREHPLHQGISVESGEAFLAGATLGFLRVGSLLRAVTAPAAGTMIQPLANDHQPVGFGDPLFKIEPLESAMTGSNGAV